LRKLGILVDGMVEQMPTIMTMTIQEGIEVEGTTVIDMIDIVLVHLPAEAHVPLILEIRTTMMMVFPALGRINGGI